jgi:hypothetical protein
MRKRVPKFKNDDEERDFWSEKDSSEYLNWKSAERVLFPNLKSSANAILSPNIDEFDALIRQAHDQAKKTGLKKKDIQSAIAKVRRRPSRRKSAPGG